MKVNFNANSNLSVPLRGYSVRKSNQVFSGRTVNITFDIFYRMNGYNTDYNWAFNMAKLTFGVVDLMKNDAAFDDILKIIEKNLAVINKNEEFGKLDENNKYPEYKFCDFKRGREYFDRYYDKFSDIIEDEFCFIKNAKSNEEYKDANCASIVASDIYGMSTVFGRGDKTNLELVKREYEKFRKISKPTIEEINRTCAVIQWLIAQETPYLRGSDSMANTLVRAIYVLNGVKVSPIKDGKGFDFEAWGSDLDEYIENYPDLYKSAPHF